MLFSISNVISQLNARGSICASAHSNGRTVMRNLLFSAVAGAALFSSSGAIAGTMGNDYTLSVNNRSSTTVTELYATNIGDEGWGDDLLEGDRIRPGRSYVVDVDDYSGYCVYDLRAVDSRGDEWEDRLNVCDEADWTLVD